MNSINFVTQLNPGRNFKTALFTSVLVPIIAAGAKVTITNIQAWKFKQIIQQKYPEFAEEVKVVLHDFILELPFQIF